MLTVFTLTPIAALAAGGQTTLALAHSRIGSRS